MDEVKVTDEEKVQHDSVNAPEVQTVELVAPILLNPNQEPAKSIADIPKKHRIRRYFKPLYDLLDEYKDYNYVLQEIQLLPSPAFAYEAEKLMYEQLVHLLELDDSPLDKLVHTSDGIGDSFKTKQEEIVGAPEESILPTEASCAVVSSPDSSCASDI